METITLETEFGNILLGHDGGATWLTGELKREKEDPTTSRVATDEKEYNDRLDGIESLLLALWSQSAFRLWFDHGAVERALHDAVQACGNN